MPRALPDNFRSPAAVARFMLTAAVGLVLDLWTKNWAFARLAPYGLETSPGGRIRVRLDNEMVQEYQFIPRLLHFRAMANQGAVFGLGQGYRMLFLFVSLLAIVFIFYLFATSGRQRFYQFVLGLLLAGVLGNLYDRARFSYVRDMIYIFPRRLLWGGGGREVFPWIFNVADSLLCVGVFLIIVYLLFAGAPPDSERLADEDEGEPAGRAVSRGD